MGKRRFIKNALIMTVAMAAMRCVGTVFMVYISNRVGAEGIGLFQLVSSVYLLAITLSTSGVSLAVIRIVSEETALQNGATAQSAYRRCFLLSILLGVLAGALLYCFSDPLGNVVLHDNRTVVPLRILSFGLPFLSAGSVIRGCFIGLQKPVSAVSGDIVEQLSDVAVTIPLLNYLAPKGLGAACCALVIGSVLSEITSCLYSFILYRLHPLKGTGKVKNGLSRRIFSISAPVAVSNYFRSFLTTVENVLVPPSLKKFGATSGEALSQYGLIKGMAMPILTLPAAILSAFSNLLVPEVSGLKALKKEKQIEFITFRCFKATLLFAFFNVGIFFSYSREIALLLYHSEKVGTMLLILTPLVPFLYLDQIVDSILKGLNQQVFTMKLNTVDSLCRVLIICFLVPMWGVRGYLIMFFCGTIGNAAFSIGRLVMISRVEFQFWNWVVKPALLSAGVCVLVKCLPFHLFLSVFAAGILYLLFLRWTNCLTRDEIRWVKGIFQKGRKRKRG